MGQMYLQTDIFYQKFDLYLTATGKTSAADAVKSALLLRFVGNYSLRTFNTFKFSGIFIPILLLAQEKHHILKIHWEEGEKFDNFLTSLKILVRNYKFADKEDSIIQD
ncbi:hypothetical protein PR048_001229 [Dryococelus australis]|uniref:Uncharacterized protein n=1 Tax=Dryococelus australis TaxID=614101 RepID=A0ABQ9IGX5_9NEOP|nr:hypothetical protein PR048_001229 [Dryococelus australis]